jgi:hypothetical protein
MENHGPAEDHSYKGLKHSRSWEPGSGFLIERHNEERRKPWN